MKKCILCLVVICQSSNNTKYAFKMIYIVACFKKLWKTDPKQAWLDYFLINPSGKVDKFMANDCFNKRIILLNKEKICPSANTTFDKFLRKIITIKVNFLQKCQKVISCVTGAISHGNYHNPATKLPNILVLIKYLTKDSLFHEKLGQTGM